LNDLLISRGHHATFARGHMLDRVEREAADVAEQTGVNALVSGADCKRTILDYEQIVAPCEAGHTIHVNRKAEVMNNADSARARRDFSLNLVNRDVASVRIGVGEDDGRAGELDRVRGCDMGLRRHDNLVARPDAEIEIGQVQRGGAGADAGGMAAADVARKLSLESF